MSLREDFTFSRFVRTPASAAAWRLALAVAEGRTDAPRVLLFHGPSGTGKTHLLHAIAHTTVARTAAAQIRTVSASDLSSQLVEGLRSDQVAADRRWSFAPRCSIGWSGNPGAMFGGSSVRQASSQRDPGSACEDRSTLACGSASLRWTPSMIADDDGRVVVR